MNEATIAISILSISFLIFSIIASIILYFLHKKIKYIHTRLYVVDELNENNHKSNVMLYAEYDKTKTSLENYLMIIHKNHSETTSSIDELRAIIEAHEKNGHRRKAKNGTGTESV